MTVVMTVSIGVGIRHAEATTADHLYAMTLAGGIDRGSGWYGLELGVEYDRYRPHNIIGGVLAFFRKHPTSRIWKLRAVFVGLAASFSVIACRSKWPCSPFVGITAVESFPGLDDSYITVNPETGFSFPIAGRFDAGLCLRYCFNTDGRASDIWTCGIGISYDCR